MVGFYFIAVFSPLGCDITLNQDSGVIVSPGQAINQMYPNNLNCKFTIEATATTTILQLKNDGAITLGATTDTVKVIYFALYIKVPARLGAGNVGSRSSESKRGSQETVEPDPVSSLHMMCNIQTHFKVNIA